MLISLVVLFVMTVPCSSQDVESMVRARFGDHVRVAVDDKAGVVRDLVGSHSFPRSRPVAESDYVALARSFLASNADLFGVTDAELVTRSAVLLPLSAAGTTDKFAVSFRQAVNGVEVHRASACVLMGIDGNILSVQNHTVSGALMLSLTASLSPLMARAT